LLREYRPAIVILELGANDGLRGSDLSMTRSNLDAMVKDAQAARARVLVLGMKVPPNYGPAYTREFDAIFADVARARNAALVPWLFDGFGADLTQFQADHIHPLAAAEPRILDNVWPALLPLIGKRADAAPRRSAR
jgi:acyl-CoA thioesterase-1